MGQKIDFLSPGEAGDIDKSFHLTFPKPFSVQNQPQLHFCTLHNYAKLAYLAIQGESLQGLSLYGWTRLDMVERTNLRMVLKDCYFYVSLMGQKIDFLSPGEAGDIDQAGM
jgi:hypothetical protein